MCSGQWEACPQSNTTTPCVEPESNTITPCIQPEANTITLCQKKKKHVARIQYDHAKRSQKQAYQESNAVNISDKQKRIQNPILSMCQMCPDSDTVTLPGARIVNKQNWHRIQREPPERLKCVVKNLSVTLPFQLTKQYLL